jgi:hypothetical protein
MARSFKMRRILTSLTPIKLMTNAKQVGSGADHVGEG